MKLRTVLLLIPVFVSGCAAISGAPDFCSVYTPVPTLHCGTPYQKLTVDQNNGIYLYVCGGG